MATMKNMPQLNLRDYISETAEHAEVRVGAPLPLGTQESGSGVNFALFSRNATGVRSVHYISCSMPVPMRLISICLP